MDRKIHRKIKFQLLIQYEKVFNEFSCQFAVHEKETFEAECVMLQVKLNFFFENCSSSSEQLKLLTDNYA